jgi:hypothetical protein
MTFRSTPDWRLSYQAGAGWLRAFPVADGSAAGAARSGEAADESGLSPAGQHAFARVAGSVERAAAPSAAFAVRECSSFRLAGALCLAAAAASDAADFVSRPTGPAAVGISGPWQASRWRAPRTYAAELRWHGYWNLHVPLRYLLAAPHWQALRVREPCLWRRVKRGWNALVPYARSGPQPGRSGALCCMSLLPPWGVH